MSMSRVEGYRLSLVIPSYTVVSIGVSDDRIRPSGAQLTLSPDRNPDQVHMNRRVVVEVRSLGC